MMKNYKIPKTITERTEKLNESPKQTIPARKFNNLIKHYRITHVYRIKNKFIK